MRHSMTGSRSVQSNGVVSRHNFTLKGVSALLAVAGVMALAPAFAKDPAAAEVKPTGKAPAVQAQAQAHADSVAIPECLEKLKLSAAQQVQVKEIVHNYDRSIGVVWKQFSDRYMQAICLETSLLAAIEDNLTESQREQVRHQRHITAQHEKAQAVSNTKVNQAPVKPNVEARKAIQTAEKSNDATAKPAQAVEEGLAAAGVTLTDEQEAAADKVQDKYRSQLRSLNRDIGRLHIRLVSLEADKLAEIEKVLTKEQLAQLRMHRQNAPDTQKVASNETKAE